MISLQIQSIVSSIIIIREDKSFFYQDIIKEFHTSIQNKTYIISPRYKAKDCWKFLILLMRLTQFLKNIRDIEMPNIKSKKNSITYTKTVHFLWMAENLWKN